MLRTIANKGNDDCKLPNYRGYFSPYFIHGYITYITVGILKCEVCDEENDNTS